MATVKTIESSFDSMTEEQRKANLSMVGYIKSLASMTNTDINRWDILKIFGSGEGANLIVDKKAVNKIFFEKLEKIVDKKTDEIADLESIPELSRALETSFMQTVESQKSSLKYNIDEMMRNIESRNNQIQQLITQLNEVQKQYNLIMFNPEPLIEIKREIQEVLKAGYWVNPIVHNGFLYFNTPNNIRLSHKNRAAGIDCELDLGQLAVRINLTNFYMDVIPYKNNICHDEGSYSRGARLYHPHVNANAQICWGNALATMQNHMKTFQIGKVLSLLYVLLTSYNDAAPYIHLTTLRDHHKKFSRIPQSLKHPDKIKAKATPGAAPAAEEDGDPDFIVGDRITYELRGEQGTEPRWDFNEDRSGYGVMAFGTVESVSADRITTRSDNGETWNWPNYGSGDFVEGQWSRTGYMRYA